MLQTMSNPPDLAAVMQRGDAADAPQAPARRAARILRHGAALLVAAAAGATLYAYAPELIKTDSAEPPVNFVAASQRIDTSGQPSADQLAGLKDKGYGVVINLAPPTSFGSLPDEGRRVSQTGIAYVNIPVDWRAPRYEDFELFSDILDHAGGRRALVHCQINKRASLFTFLYQVVRERENPDVAYERVTAIWTPDEHWKAFAGMVLARHKIDFEPY